MDTIIDTPDTDTDTAITSDVAVIEDSSTDSFGKEVSKTILVSIATTAVLAGGTFVASYAVAKVQQFRIQRALKKAEEAVEAKIVDITSMQDPKQD